MRVTQASTQHSWLPLYTFKYVSAPWIRSLQEMICRWLVHKEKSCVGAGTLISWNVLSQTSAITSLQHYLQVLHLVCVPQTLWQVCLCNFVGEHAHLWSRHFKHKYSSLNSGEESKQAPLSHNKEQPPSTIHWWRHKGRCKFCLDQRHPKAQGSKDDVRRPAAILLSLPLPGGTGVLQARPTTSFAGQKLQP